MKRLPIGASVLLGLCLTTSLPAQTDGSGNTYMAGQPLGPPAPGIEAIQSPVRIAADSSGNLWVTDHVRKKVLIIDSVTMEVVLEFAVPGRPTALAINEESVYIGNDDEGRIDVYDTSGYFQFSFVIPVGQPNDIAISPVHDRLFVVSGTDRLVHVFNLEGTLIDSLPESGAEPLGHPTSVALYQPPLRQDVSGDGVVNVTDLLALLAAWGRGGPADIDDSGVVNVTDLLELLANWSRTLDEPEVFISDFGDANPANLIDPAVRIYDINGLHLRTISGVGVFSRPQGLVCDDLGQLFIADSLLCKVLVFDRASGTMQRTLGEFGAGEGQLKIPLDLLVNETSADVFVTDNRNGRIVAFRQGGLLP